MVSQLLSCCRCKALIPWTLHSNPWDAVRLVQYHTPTHDPCGHHAYPTLQAGPDSVIRRPREHSLFGVAEKRAPAPFRSGLLLSVTLKSLCHARSVCYKIRFASSHLYGQKGTSLA